MQLECKSQSSLSAYMAEKKKIDRKSEARLNFNCIWLSSQHNENHEIHRHKAPMYHFPLESDNWISYEAIQKRISSERHKSRGSLQNRHFGLIKFLSHTRHKRDSRINFQTMHFHECPSGLSYMRFMCWLICIRISLRLKWQLVIGK